MEGAYGSSAPAADLSARVGYPYSYMGHYGYAPGGASMGGMGGGGYDPNLLVYHHHQAAMMSANGGRPPQYPMMGAYYGMNQPFPMMNNGSYGGGERGSREGVDSSGSGDRSGSCRAELQSIEGDNTENAAGEGHTDDHRIKRSEKTTSAACADSSGTADENNSTGSTEGNGRAATGLSSATRSRVTMNLGFGPSGSREGFTGSQNGLNPALYSHPSSGAAPRYHYGGWMPNGPPPGYPSYVHGQPGGYASAPSDLSLDDRSYRMETTRATGTGGETGGGTDKAEGEERNQDSDEADTGSAGSTQQQQKGEQQQGQRDDASGDSRHSRYSYYPTVRSFGSNGSAGSGGQTGAEAARAGAHGGGAGAGGAPWSVPVSSNFASDPRSYAMFYPPPNGYYGYPGAPVAQGGPSGAAGSDGGGGHQSLSRPNTGDDNGSNQSQQQQSRQDPDSLGKQRHQQPYVFDHTNAPPLGAGYYQFPPHMYGVRPHWAGHPQFNPAAYGGPVPYLSTANSALDSMRRVSTTEEFDRLSATDVFAPKSLGQIDFDLLASRGGPKSKASTGAPADADGGDGRGDDPGTQSAAPKTASEFGSIYAVDAAGLGSIYGAGSFASLPSFSAGLPNVASGAIGLGSIFSLNSFTNLEGGTAAAMRALPSNGSILSFLSDPDKDQKFQLPKTAVSSAPPVADPTSTAPATAPLTVFTAPAAAAGSQAAATDVGGDASK